ncbi:hypothetical protein [Novosphingobium sp. Leaf2]|uniref:hypothetical protein n=1 Tax=Novosphingobium sp. Leaf2 TaxID=1735670 RepID=UPI0006FD34AC|nr:hypothetical protein [Novosphingobium sp. Leaf2]KQM17493.1 hypothetical protein ASE49_10660 [Novosphingobium sp. Leaf2]
MRAVLPVLAILLLTGGCKRQPSFDERYDAATHDVVTRARTIDAQVAASTAPPDEETPTR